MRFLALRLIDIYQVFFSFDKGILAVLAPGGACKYEVTCSEFTKQQIIKHGVISGSYLGLRRIISCR